MPEELHVVTGAFGYSGQYIAEGLLADGRRVRTLTNSSGRTNPFGARVEVRPLAFDRPDVLVESLRGASVLYNTYWVRFNHRTFSHAEAVANTLVLFDGADILVNNIAWALRNLPVFGVFGPGQYRLQPIHVADFAALAIQQGRHGPNRIVDATGPETFSYRELVQRLGAIIGCRRPIVSVPPALGHIAASLLGLFVRDVVLTREEIDGLMADLLVTDSPPAGSTRLTDWATAHADQLGRRYASELARRRNRRHAYDML